MRKIVLILFALPNLCHMTAQQTLDTLFANEHQIHSLIFESPIKKGIVGSQNFTFNFNRDRAEDIGLLQAKAGTNSNLLVKTQNGALYSFVIAYKEELGSFISFINDSSRLNPKKPEVKIPENNALDTSKNNRYAKLCRQLLNNNRTFNQIRSQKGIRLKATESIYHGDEVYIVYEIKNASAIDYEVDGLQLLKVLGNKTKKSSYQELAVEPLYQFQFPEKVFQGNSIRFVVVYPKFTLGINERLKVILREKNGNRNFTFGL